MAFALRISAWHLAGVLLAPALAGAEAPLPPNLPQPVPDSAWIAALHADPTGVSARVEALARSVGHGVTVAGRLRAMGRLGGEANEPAPPASASPRIDAPGDPLAHVVRDWPGVLESLPSEALLGGPSRTEVAHLLLSVRQARRMCRDAMGSRIAPFDANRLVDRATASIAGPEGERDWLESLAAIDRGAMLAGLEVLAGAAQRFRDYARRVALPPVNWQVDTPEGRIVVDFTRRDDHSVLGPVLLVVDAGGNDRYEFAGPAQAGRASLLLDLGGDDRYVSLAPGADPSSGVLGCGALWDAGGDDVHEGGTFAQAAALGGAALLVDEGGTNRFEADGYAQGFATAGWALFVTGAGRDTHLARTHAQGSAGPGGIGFLVDEGGDDDYVLSSDRLLRPSSQLPDRNASLGQGAGGGSRAKEAGGRHRPGGLGALVDLGGDDRYRADVFAQGAGLLGGAGALVDLSGHDSREGAWYVQGAAAHGGAGVLLDLGGGNDRYRASHSTSLAAAHDRSLAILLDDGGDDAYRLGDLGLGAAHDGGVARFIDAGGEDRVRVDSPRCRAFGTAWRSDPDARRLRFVNEARFESRAPPSCRGDGEGAR